MEEMEEMEETEEQRSADADITNIRNRKKATETESRLRDFTFLSCVI